MTASRSNDDLVFITGPRGDFEALLSMLSRQHFCYEPQGLAAARAYDVIRETLDAVIEEDVEGAAV